VEKWVFSLSDRSKMRSFVLSTLFWVPWLAFNTLIGHSMRDPWRWYGSLVTLVVIAIVCPVRMASDQQGRAIREAIVLDG